MIPYLGYFKHRVDPSHRIMLPSEWRPEGAPNTFTVIPWPVYRPEYLLVLPPSRWSVLEENINKQSLTDERAANAVRVLSSQAAWVALDRFGRLPLTPRLLESVRLGEEAVLAGSVAKFEIWRPEAYALAQATALSTVKEVLPTLML
jgi:division/cell wall cluster transcriptional repressor MraZ